jgi:hypothetical protein
LCLTILKWSDRLRHSNPERPAKSKIIFCVAATWILLPLIAMTNALHAADAIIDAGGPNITVGQMMNACEAARNLPSGWGLYAQHGITPGVAGETLTPSSPLRAGECRGIFVLSCNKGYGLPGYVPTAAEVNAITGKPCIGINPGLGGTGGMAVNAKGGYYCATADDLAFVKNNFVCAVDKDGLEFKLVPKNKMYVGYTSKGKMVPIKRPERLIPPSKVIISDEGKGPVITKGTLKGGAPSGGAAKGFLTYKQPPCPKIPVVSRPDPVMAKSTNIGNLTSFAGVKLATSAMNVLTDGPPSPTIGPFVDPFDAAASSIVEYAAPSLQINKANRNAGIRMTQRIRDEINYYRATGNNPWPVRDAEACLQSKLDALEAMGCSMDDE